ncbi:MAG: lysophospholipid acyltransferase family protein [Smithellaceae bacterium]
MQFFQNTKYLSFQKRPKENRIVDPLKSGNGSLLLKKYSSAVKALSSYILQNRLMIVAYYITRSYFMTVRIESINEEMVRQHLKNGNKLIAALWHQRILSSIGYAKGFGVYRPSVMISESRDGDMIADVFSRMNFRPVRGSSSRNGKKALAAMLNDLKDHSFAVHVLDGPKGPKGVVKPGLIVLAEKTGIPVVPVYISVNRAWVLRSWDRCLVPKPFSKIVIRWDQPIAISQKMNEQSFEEIRLKLEKHMLNNQRQDDRRLGWQNLI